MGPQQLLCYFYHAHVRYTLSRSQSHHFMSDVSQPTGVGVFYFLFFNIKCCISSSSYVAFYLIFIHFQLCAIFSMILYPSPTLCKYAVLMYVYIFFNWCGHVVLHLSVLRKLYFSFSLFYVYH